MVLRHWTARDECWRKSLKRSKPFFANSDRWIQIEYGLIADFALVALASLMLCYGRIQWTAAQVKYWHIPKKTEKYERELHLWKLLGHGTARETGVFRYLKGGEPPGERDGSGKIQGAPCK